MTAWDESAVNPITQLYDTMRVGGTNRPTAPRTITRTELAEHIEAQARMLMATGLTEDRGFDTGRTRADDIAAIDCLLDRWLELTQSQS